MQRKKNENLATPISIWQSIWLEKKRRTAQWRMGFVDNQLGKDQKKKPSNPSVKWFDVVEDEVIAFYRVLPGFTGFYRVFQAFFLIVPDFSGFD